MEEPLCPLEFSYEAVNTHFNSTNKWLNAKNYSAAILPRNTNFIGFAWMGRVPKDRSSEGSIFAKYGLKFHISLPEHNKEMYRVGWDIVIGVLIRHQVGSFKGIRSNCKISDTPGQEGKDITLYADADPYRTLEAWKNILEEVTNRLAEAKIEPGYRAPGTETKPEKPVEGSNYITWRYCDEEAERKGKISEWPQEDPCLKIKIACRFLQPEVRVVDSGEKAEKVVNLTKYM